MVFAYALLSQLNHLWSLGFFLTYAALALLLQLKFFKQRKAFVWNNNDHFIHLYLCDSDLFPFFLSVLSQQEQCSSSVFLSQSVTSNNSSIVLPRWSFWLLLFLLISPSYTLAPAHTHTLYWRVFGLCATLGVCSTLSDMWVCWSGERLTGPRVSPQRLKLEL